MKIQYLIQYLTNNNATVSLELYDNKFHAYIELREDYELSGKVVGETIGYPFSVDNADSIQNALKQLSQKIGETE